MPRTVGVASRVLKVTDYLVTKAAGVAFQVGNHWIHRNPQPSFKPSWSDA